MSLRPFFSFYGGKWRDAPRLYPAPTRTRIVEPFAGSAGYSLRYPDADVTLCDIDPEIAGLWRYLIQVTPAEVRRLPDFGDADTVDDLNICQEARTLIGFWLNRGSSSSRKRPSRWMREGLRPGSFWGERVRQTIASQVDAIKHWRIIEGCYEQCPNLDATWFVDPPYQGAGRHYRYGSDRINFARLGDWCRTRRGQCIACEAQGATWLPFRPLASTKTTRKGKRSPEAMWTAENVA